MTARGAHPTERPSGGATFDETWVFLSPHFDDVAFSCGSLVAKLAAGGVRVVVVTVCGGTPSGPFSGFARSLHATWHVADEECVPARRREDVDALTHLGPVEHEWGASLDAIYRLPAVYDRHETLHREPTAGDPLLTESGALLADLRGRYPDAVFVAPLALGGHVDHRWVHLAARSVGGKVRFYEDFPYCVMDPASLAARLGQIEPPLRPESYDVSAFLDQRTAAIARYRTQIRDLFGDEDRMRELVLRHTRASDFAETIWSTAPASLDFHGGEFA